MCQLIFLTIQALTNPVSARHQRPRILTCHTPNQQIRSKDPIKQSNVMGDGLRCIHIHRLSIPNAFILNYYLLSSKYELLIQNKFVGAWRRCCRDWPSSSEDSESATFPCPYTSAISQPLQSEHSPTERESFWVSCILPLTTSGDGDRND